MLQDLEAAMVCQVQVFVWRSALNKFFRQPTRSIATKQIEKKTRPQIDELVSKASQPDKQSHRKSDCLPSRPPVLPCYWGGGGCNR